MDAKNRLTQNTDTHFFVTGHLQPLVTITIEKYPLCEVLLRGSFGFAIIVGEGFQKLESKSSTHKYLVIMFLTLLKGASETYKSPENGAPNRRARYRLMAIRSVAIPLMTISMP